MPYAIEERSQAASTLIQRNRSQNQIEIEDSLSRDYYLSLRVSIDIQGSQQATKLELPSASDCGVGMSSAATPATDYFPLRLAFLAFYDDLERFLTSHISAGEPIQASDIVQETYAKAFRSVATFAGDDDGDFRRWLLVIAKNALTDTRRKLQEEKCGRTDECCSLSAADSQTPSRCAATDERRKHLVAATAALPDEERASIEQFYFGASHTKRSRRSWGVRKAPCTIYFAERGYGSAAHWVLHPGSTPTVDDGL